MFHARDLHISLEKSNSRSISIQVRFLFCPFGCYLVNSGLVGDNKALIVLFGVLMLEFW
jgi:hypothetical protein